VEKLTQVFGNRARDFRMERGANPLGSRLVREMLRAHPSPPLGTSPRGAQVVFIEAPPGTIQASLLPTVDATSKAVERGGPLLSQWRKIAQDYCANGRTGGATWPEGALIDLAYRKQAGETLLQICKERNTALCQAFATFDEADRALQRGIDEIAADGRDPRVWWQNRGEDLYHRRTDTYIAFIREALTCALDPEPLLVDARHHRREHRKAPWRPLQAGPLRRRLDDFLRRGGRETYAVRRSAWCRNALRALLAPSVLRAVRPVVERAFHLDARGWCPVSEQAGMELVELLRDHADLIFIDPSAERRLLAGRFLLVRAILGDRRAYLLLLRDCGLRPGWWLRPAWSRKGHKRRKIAAQTARTRAGGGPAPIG
jgi:hypothetical protein